MIGGNRIEFPLQFPGSYVERANETVAGIDDAVFDTHRRDHPVADYDGSRCGVPGSDAIAFEIPVSHVARVAHGRTEVAAGGARIAIDGVDVAVDIALEDALPA